MAKLPTCPESAGRTAPPARWLPFLLIFCAAFLVNANSLLDGFVYDDSYQVVGNSWIRDWSHLGQFFATDVWAFAKMKSNYYRPLMHVCYLVVYQLFGLRPWAFHLWNVMLHGGVCLLVYLLGSRLVNSSSSRGPSWLTPAFVAAILFAVHPVHSEVVAWIAGLPDLLCASFYLASFYCYLRSDTPFDRNLAFSLLFFFAATLSKEIAVTLPAMVLVYELACKERESLTSLLKRILPFAAVAALYFLMRHQAVGAFAPKNYHPELTAYHLVLNALVFFFQYLGKLVLPINLQAAYEFHGVTSMLDAKVLLSLGVLAIASVIAVRSRDMLKKEKNLPIFLAFLVIPLAPAFYIVANITPFADRYLYLPSVGFLLFVAWGLDRLVSRKERLRGVVLAACGVIAVSYSVGTFVRNGVWQDDYQLWMDATRKSPGNSIAHYYLGKTGLETGRLDVAIRELSLATRLTPPVTKGYVDLGKAYEAAGEPDKAMEQYLASLRLDPRDSMAHYNLGCLLASKGELDEAIKHYQVSIDLHPTVQAYENLAVAYDNKGVFGEAVRFYRIAMQLDPNHVNTYYNLAMLYLQQGDKNAALPLLRRAVELDPANQLFSSSLADALR